MNLITVVIPCREGEDAKVTLDSLSRQTFKDFKTVVISDEGLGANWARNKGFKKHADTQYVLFSDNDITWVPDALGNLYEALLLNPSAAYSYGSYIMDDSVYCDRLFDPELLKKTNFISTMSLIRSTDFPGFDEKILRLQDWDLWVTMLLQGKHGVSCDKLIFTTEPRPGISYGMKMDADEAGIRYEEAVVAVQSKHGLL